MSRRIDICHQDVYYLNKLSMEGLIDSNNQPLSYKDLVVLKPWGYEFLAFENGRVAIWILYIKKRHSTSMHCHPKKTTALMVLDDLHQFGYFHFIEGRKNNIFSTQNFEASLREYQSNGDFVANFTAQEGEKFLICRGAVCWGENHSLGVGEIFDTLSNQKQPYWITEPLTLFVIKKR